MRFTAIAILLTLVTLGAARGQEANFSLPALGHLYDSDTRALRPIHGVIGAATVGEPLGLPFAISSAVSASGLDFALVKTQEEQKVFLIRGLRNELLIQELAGIPAGDSLIELAASGRVAVVYSSTASSIHVIAGLPDRHFLQRSIETGGARVRSVAVSDDARFVLAAFETGSDNSTLLRVHDAETGGWKDLGPAAHVTSIAFAPNGNDIAIAADFPPSVSTIRDLAGAAEWTLIAGEADGVTAPAAVRFSAGSALWVATASAITRIQLSDRSRTELHCACKPTSLAELDGGSTFRLTELSREPVWVLQDSAEGPKLLFIPPPPAAAESGEAGPL